MGRIKFDYAKDVQMWVLIPTIVFGFKKEQKEIGLIFGILCFVFTIEYHYYKKKKDDKR